MDMLACLVIIIVNTALPLLFPPLLSSMLAILPKTIARVSFRKFSRGGTTGAIWILTNAIWEVGVCLNVCGVHVSSGF